MLKYAYVARCMVDDLMDTPMIDRDCPPISGSLYAESLGDAADLAQREIDANWVNTLVVEVRISDQL